MNASPPIMWSRRRQQGAAAVVIAMLLAFILVAAVLGVLSISGSSVMDAGKNEEQIAALFLAESGIEAALGAIKSASQSGTYDDSTCAGFSSLGSSSLGRGTFSYLFAVADPGDPSCPAGADSCCTMLIKGAIGSSSRTLRTVISNRTIPGIEGFGSDFTLNIFSKKAGAGVFTNLAYRAKMGGGSNASVGSCTNTGGNCLIGNTGYQVGTGTGNVSDMGVYSDVATPGTYTITDTLVDNSSSPAPRNYVQTGAMFYPASGHSVSFVGAYSSGTGSHKTVGTSQTSSSFPDSWNCAAANGTASAGNAANADTLLYGFSSYPSSAGNLVNNVSFGQNASYVTINGTQYFTNQQLYMRQRLAMVGTQGDNLYSQIWYAYNPAYISPTGAANGANFSGTIGATFSGAITGGGATLALNSDLNPNAILTVGDQITNAAGSTTYGTLGALKTGTWGANGSTYNINASADVGSATLLAKSHILKLAAAPSAGVLTFGDAITSSGGGTTYGTLGALTGGIPGAANSTYMLTGVAADRQISLSNLESAGTTITTSGAVSSPAAGTAIAVSAGTGLFDLANVIGSISGFTLSVTNVISGTLSVGDALFGPNVKPNTVITALGSGSGGTGTYSVNNAHSQPNTGGSGAIVGRAAVQTVASANSYTVSRKPTTRLSNSAQLCGGVCALFFDNSGSENTSFNLNNLLAGDDWASGFACINGIDPAQITVLGAVAAKRSSWNEPVQ